ncbi:hypothetical protein BDY19DRAFT_398984 [Irpex rosettiformis]|uniref:Uncharacterized protein n=1 Tax=Irpex rosettiformis TaxID=378272 RepID=A0ACB8UF96_9APHY|nr:hypothetical protein BDY19DRAFT_398984 [Irpex rosettiformis]
MHRHAVLRHNVANMIPRTNRTSPTRIFIQSYTVFDHIPHRFLSNFNFKFSELYGLRKQRPVVAWYASETEPNVVPLLAFVGFLFLAVFVLSQVPGVLACRTTLWHRLRSLKLHRNRECFSPPPLQPSQLQSLHGKYQYVVGKLNKVVKKYQALQVQLKEQDARLQHTQATLKSTTHDLESLQSQNRRLNADNETLTNENEQLKTDNATLERHVKEQFYEQERRVQEFEREQEQLEQALQFLEGEQESMTTKCQGLVRRFHTDNEELKNQLAEQSTSLVELRSSSSSSLSQLQSQLDATKLENELLRHQLADNAVAYDTRQKSLQQQLHETEARLLASVEQLHDENSSLKQQLEDQESEHTRQRNIWLERISLANADQSEVKAKLERIQNDLETKSANAERRECCSQLRDSFVEDLSFAHLESECTRTVYEGQLSTAQAEIAALREQLDNCVKRYERRAARLALAEAEGADKDRLTSRLKALEAQKKVSDDLENMLADALRSYEDKYETLEISFDVLESAYSFLAAELVMTEHSLKEERGLRRQLRRQLRAYEQPGEPLPEENEVEDAESVADVQEAVEEDEEEKLVDVQPLAEVETMATAIEEEEEEDDTRVPTAMSFSAMSTFSERSWPATPGLSFSSMSSITTGSSLRSPLGSPIVMSPLSPSLILPGKPPSEGPHSAYPPDDPDDVFGGWAILDGRNLDST